MTAFWCSIPRDVVLVEGPDAQTYLHSQVSNDLRPLQVGQSCWAFLLQPTGKVDVLTRVWRRGEESFVLDTDAGFGEVLVARVNRFKIRVKADVTPLDWTCLAVRSADGSDVVAPDVVAPDVVAPDVVAPDVVAPDVAGVVVGWGGGYDLLGPEPVPPADAVPGTDGDLLAARVAAAWPAMGSEIVPGETIPAETGVTPVAVSFTKGCYPGQELVERMDSRGSMAPRLLQVVDVPAGAAPGDPLVRDGDTIGALTSVAGTRAIASVKRSAIVA